MKDLLKRLLCIVMALTMVVALVACGSTEEEDDDEGSKRGGKNKETTEETPEETTEEPEEETPVLVGEWEAKIDMSDYMSDQMYYEMGMDIDVEDYIVTMTIEFYEDGTYEADMDASEAEDAMVGIMDQMWPMLVEMYAEQYGMSYEEMEAGLEAEGMTKDVLMADMDLQSGIDEEFEDFAEGEWILDGDELYMAPRKPEKTEPIEIEFDGNDEFSIVGGEFTGDEDLDEYIMPIVFERV